MTNGMMLPEPQKASEQVKAMVVEVEEKVNALAREASGLVIKDAETRTAAGNVNALLGSAEKMVEARLRETFAPFKQFEAGIRALARPVQDKIGSIRDPLRRAIAEDATRQEREAAALAAKENARIGKQYERATAKAEKKGEDAPPPPPKVEVVVAKQAGATVIRKVWDFEVTAINQVPAEYLMVERGPLLTAIRKLADEGKPVVIPGVRAYQRTAV